jgi:hypothetical protein
VKRTPFFGMLRLSASAAQLQMQLVSNEYCQMSVSLFDEPKCLNHPLVTQMDVYKKCVLWTKNWMDDSKKGQIWMDADENNGKICSKHK